MFNKIISKYKQSLNDLKTKYAPLEPYKIDPALKKEFVRRGGTKEELKKRIDPPKPSFISRAINQSRPPDYTPKSQPVQPQSKPAVPVKSTQPTPVAVPAQVPTPPKPQPVQQTKPVQQQDFKIASKSDFSIDNYIKDITVKIDKNGTLREEGNTLAIENNNPGNLKYAGQPNAVKGRDNFAKFPNPQIGFRALYMDVLAKQKPERNLNLEEMMNIYSPPEENDTELYIETLEGWLGVKKDILVADIDPLNLAKYIARFESQTDIF